MYVNKSINTDMVIPNGNEQEFIDVALSLGYKEIIFLTDNLNYKKFSSNKIKVKFAFLIKDPSQILKARKNFDYVVGFAERKFFESKVDFIIGIEQGQKDSFHYRSTNVNQVHAALSKKSGSILVFDFSSLFANPRVALGRMYQISVLVRKYRLNYTSFSLAKTPLESRSRTILDSLLKVLRL